MADAVLVSTFALPATIAFRFKFPELYRAYTLWDRQLSIAIAPIILMLSSFGASLYGIITYGKGSVLSTTNILAGDKMLKNGVIGVLIFAGSTLVTNLSLTALIVYRVRQLSQITNRYLPSSEHVNNKPLIRLVIGSCLLYPIAIVTMFVAICTARGADSTLVAPMIALIMGISPTFMIVEIDLALNSPISGPKRHGGEKPEQVENSHALAASNI
ncbi:hypothetical protein GYMLUDRAFT_41482 [Collybiopsis luxurians FD-317 M1]|uniref:Uncharacterized protein n=1 Tax=Collybiopsis luxurians FD-317 M1 TaxID=944289 RepID=A0A0D0CJY6_9AGAR|nr:hypothetical protein GYMLUDRAFT_41482 [Collybiopsis luxurians FD-317 M1]